MSTRTRETTREKEVEIYATNVVNKPKAWALTDWNNMAVNFGMNWLSSESNYKTEPYLSSRYHIWCLY
jgi:hypothetical protein